MKAQFPSWLEVDLDAVEANVRWLQRSIGPECEIAAVVKAQAYGLGAEEVARAALRAGATRLAVARAQEGAALRRAGIGAPILVLSSLVPAEVEACCRYGLTPTVVDTVTLELIDRAASEMGRPLAVHVKVDTGLTRYGAQLEAVKALGCALLNSKWVIPEGFYTHFASSDDPDLTFTFQQLERYRQAHDVLRGLGLEFKLLHSANSAGAIRVPQGRYSMVRAGITLNGHVPSKDVPSEGLRPALALKAVLARTYDLAPGTSIGYGRTYHVQRPMKAGLVPLGYADGIPRSLSNQGWMLVQGCRVRIIGRVSMDQLVVDLSTVPSAAEGDEVVALGSQAGETITLDELAERSDTIPHEALTRLGPRLPRVYLRSGMPTRAVMLDSSELELH